MNNPYHPYPFYPGYPPQSYTPLPHRGPAYFPQSVQPINPPVSSTGGERTWLDSQFTRGLLVGAAAAYILSNERVQQSAIKTAVTGWTLLQGSIEEMKERFLDAEAELHAAQMEKETD